ncbi:effector-associated domain EAD1-containing protein [Frankia sp. AvcI1]|uniref:effector-associated constant component EACC1 n=1 Tax=Frankia sp. AvcI1 TaxID=573496 RepID=UPI00211830AC|nr:effector-associated domain EAD1-containing protein [Frankia sp. AvcI1]
MDIELVMAGPFHEDAMRSLWNWLGREPDLRGLVRLRESPPAAGEMGPKLDAVVVTLRSSAGRSVRALEVALTEWLAAQRRGPDGTGSVRMTVRTSDHSFELSTDTIGMTDPAVRQHFEDLARFAQAQLAAEPVRPTSATVQDGAAADVLTPEQVRLLAELFSTPMAAVRLLRHAGLAPERFPTFDAAPHAEGFWAAVAVELAHGRAPGGARRLLDTAKSEYPGNPAFARAPRS